jgi:methylenetetrahydrofolate dehydrogenase (NADP+)/methenyltetrahydrofolate cyclohydrolase
MDTLIHQIGQRPYILDIIYIGDNPVIETYIQAKKRFGERIGVSVRVTRIPSTQTRSDINTVIQQLEIDSHGMIIQLPLPDTLDTKEIIELVDPSLDVDILSSTAYNHFLQEKNQRRPPVLQAVIYAIDAYDIDLTAGSICVLGNGRLVGKPIADYLRQRGIIFTQMTKADFDVNVVRAADIIFSGMGVAHMITDDMVKDGVIVFDCGTSEDGGTLLGDIHPDVAHKARYITPVPGGIGPLTVTALFNNMIIPYEL